MSPLEPLAGCQDRQEPPQVFLFLTEAHGLAQVLLFTFVCENVSRKKQKALVVARPPSGPGFESPQYPASFLLCLQAPLSSSPKDLAVPRRRFGSSPGFCQALCVPLEKQEATVSHMRAYTSSRSGSGDKPRSRLFDSGIRAGLSLSPS